MFFFNFSELGSCYRAQATPASTQEEDGCARERPAPSVAHAPRRVRKYLAASQWRPELPAISEVGAAAAASKANPTAQKKPPSRGVGSTAKNRRYTKVGASKDESRSNAHVPMIVPAFSPTPFVF